MKIAPHVALRFKRLFPKVDVSQIHRIDLRATPENSCDLRWFIDRYPMKMDLETRKRLDGLAAEHEDRVLATARILEGYIPPIGKMALPPRDYQQIAAALCHNTGRLLLGDQLGLGKTASALTLLSYEGTLPALVVVPAHLPSHWVEQTKKFLPDLSTHIIRRRDPYDVSADVLICSYHKIAGWLADFVGRFRSIIFDEAQELRRIGSFKYAACREIASSAHYRMALTGTPIYGYGIEFFNVMDALASDCLGERSEFVREWCTYDSRPEKVSLRNPGTFGTYLRDAGLMLLRTKADVGRELPPINRIVHEIEADLDAIQDMGDAAELARAILSPETDRKKRFIASGEFDAKVRQMTGVAKAPFVAEFVRMLIEQGQGPVVLWGWHRAVYDLWQEQLSDLDPAMYTGSESPSKKNKEAKRFKDGETQLLIMSLRSGIGLDGLQEVCSTGVFGELDWAFGALEQCAGRIYRDGQTSPVFLYYPISDQGADPTMVDVLGLKRQQIEGVLDPSGEIVTKLQLDPDHIKKLAKSYLAAQEKR